MRREVTQSDLCLKKSPVAAVSDIELRGARVDQGGQLGAHCNNPGEG